MDERRPLRHVAARAPNGSVPRRRRFPTSHSAPTRFRSRPDGRRRSAPPKGNATPIAAMRYTSS